MRIGILSDTHDQVARTAQAVRLLIAEGAEALVHCGDLTSPAVVRECGGLPGFYVLGNNDFDEAGLRHAIGLIGGTFLGRGGEATLGGRRVAVTHGDSPGEVRRLVSSAPDYLLMGHSHTRADLRLGSTRFINPGALHRASPWTVALLDLDHDNLRFLELR